MRRSREMGMQTFDQALFELFDAEKISYEDALRNADSVNDLRLRIKLDSKRARNADIGSDTGHLAIV
jgi:twitching motility protein PilU